MQQNPTQHILCPLRWYYPPLSHRSITFLTLPSFPGNTCDQAPGPLTPYWILIFEKKVISHGDVSVRQVPFFQWHQCGEHVTLPSVPEICHNFLAILVPVSWVVRFTKGTLRHFIGCSTEHDVVWRQVFSVVRVVSWPSDRPLVHEVSGFEKNRLSFHLCESICTHHGL